jgi:hypothetical protein
MNQESGIMDEQITIQDGLRVQPCLVCGKFMGDMPGTRDAVCKNCGYKDPCCE